MKLKNGIILFVCAFIWGVAFVGQDAADEFVAPFTFNCLRFGIGAIFLFLVSLVMVPLKRFRREKSPKQELEETKTDYRVLFLAGTLCGVALFGLSFFQQYGFVDPKMTSGKAGFLTATYILMVPLVRLFQKKIPGINVWVGVFLGLFGLYFLCISEEFEFSWGDAMVLSCALVNTFHILLVEKFSPKCDPVKLCALQCAVVSILNLPFMFFVDKPALVDIGSAMPAILFCAIMSSGIAYCLQLFGQRNVNPTPAAMIMSLESVFSAIAGAVVLGQILPMRQIVGCVILFAAILLAQLPSPRLFNRKEEISRVDSGQ